MPDANDRRREDDTSPQWGEAFARLEQETPPENGWRRFDQAMQARTRQAQAPRRDRRATWLVTLASAAVLAVVAWGPMVQWRTPTPRMPSAQIAPTPSTAPATTPPAGVASSDSGSPSAAHADAPAPTRLQLAQRALPGLERPLSAQVDRGRARHATDTLIAGLSLPAASTAFAQRTVDPLLQLQAQSRQLEALIALTRDDRVGSGASVVLASELEGAIAQVDQALAQANLEPAGREALWRQRVDALEQLAGVASTQRWLAAQGERYDAVVSVE